MNVRKILAFTSSRSDYDLLSYLYKLLSQDRDIDFCLIVSGAHLSPTYGMSIKNIEEDGIKILDKIETLIDSDSDSARIKSASILLQNAIHSVERFEPNLLIYAGDREDVVIGALIGGYMKIPTAHFYAGDHDQDGSIDNPVRHAASKLSTYKFVSIDEHKERLIAIGENTKRIYVIGSCALDKFKYELPLSREELFSCLSAERVFSAYGVVIFHPLMDYEQKAQQDFYNIMEVLKKKKIHAVVNVPNIDPGSRNLLKLMEQYRNDEKFIFVNNLPRKLFVNLLRHATFQIGNSSSGILEAPSIPLPVVNVGERMIGRKSQKNVVFAGASLEELDKAISTVLSIEFYENNVKGIKNIYGNGDSSLQAYTIIKNLDLSRYVDFRKEDPLIFRSQESYRK